MKPSSPWLAVLALNRVNVTVPLPGDRHTARWTSETGNSTRAKTCLCGWWRPLCHERARHDPPLALGAAGAGQAPTSVQEAPGAPSSSPSSGRELGPPPVQAQLAPLRSHWRPSSQAAWDWLRACPPLEELWGACPGPPQVEEALEPSSEQACLCEGRKRRERVRKQATSTLWPEGGAAVTP